MRDAGDIETEAIVNPGKRESHAKVMACNPPY
jgi:hypothetical protein